jgi:radical SAM superfamily enzyme YgiQ (UPF0313 family)
MLLIDMSSYFTTDRDNREYNVIEPPLGLMTLNSYVNRAMPGRVSSRIIKSRIDFDSYEELVELVRERKPDLIGIRAMTFYKGFFHDSIAELRKAGFTTPIIAGGPYPTASYTEVLEDENLDVVAVGEGEQTLVDVLTAMINNGNKLPEKSELRELHGLAFKSEDDDLIPAKVSAA